MSFSDEKTETLFRLLESLGPLENEELLGYFNTENIEVLRSLSGQLKDGPDLERVLSERRFIAIVRDLYQTRRIWSRRMDETLAHAAREFDQGNRIQALWIINGFIRFCPSAYYRNIAQEVMGEYEKE